MSTLDHMFDTKASPRGRVEVISDGGRRRRFTSAQKSAIVEETLLRQYNVAVGQEVRLGRTTFTVVGALQRLPGESSAVSATVAPRALSPDQGWVGVATRSAGGRIPSVQV